MKTSIIVDNKATFRSQLVAGGPGDLSVKNCTLYSKEAESIRYIPEGGDRGYFENCIISGNSRIFVSTSGITLSYCNSSQPIEGLGNISIDPLFIDADHGDFHLMPSSPCIDAGTDVGLTTDLDGNPRPIGWYDMGAYEFPYLRGDLNGDDVVDAMDLLILMEDWMKVTGP